jgi:hypothetical protein
MKLTLSFFLLAALAVGQLPQDQDRTSSLFNGRFWLKLSQDQRKSYVLGMLDQFVLSENAELVAVRKIFDGAKKVTDASTFDKISLIAMEATKASLPDMSGRNVALLPSSIDQFYSNPENRIVPIVEALRFSVRKGQGEDPTQLTKEIADRVAHWRQPGSGLN